MAFNLLKKVTVWLVNGEESPVEGEGKRDVCNVSIISLLEKFRGHKNDEHKISSFQLYVILYSE